MRYFQVPQEIRASQEVQSALIRLSIWAFMLAMLAIAREVGAYEFSWHHYLLLFGVHLAWYGGLLVSALRRPRLWPARTYVSILADLSGTTGTIYLTGDATGPFFLLYAVSFLSQGMRFGARNLLLASIGSLLAFALVAVVLGDWRSHLPEVLFVALVLVVMPAYEYVLLRKLRSAKQAAEKASRARGDFLASMTHELRTPLSGVIGMAGLLGRTELDEEQREYLESINSSAGVLQGLIGDILDLSKIDAGKLDLKPSDFALREPLSETCWTLSNQALDKGLDLVCRIDPALPTWVHGDELRFRQILFNLVGNAVKFTERGHVVVRARLMPADDGLAGPYLRIQIADTGIGMPPARARQVFDRFWQADHTSTRRYGGTGLGTTIARDLARLMGGRIGVDSVEGRGTTFTVDLPLIAAVSSAAPLPPAQLRGVRALVFEQHGDTAEAVLELCQAAGMRAEVISEIAQLSSLPAAAGTDAAHLVLIADAPTALDLEGIGAMVRQLLGPTTPIVYLHYPRRKSGFRDAAAATAFKPIDTTQLWLAMAQALGSDGAVPVDPADSGATTLEFAVAARVLVAEDDEVSAKLIDRLLTAAGCDVTVVRDGMAALDAAARTSFDLAFVDLRMPHLDGIDFTRRLRDREPADRHLPIVALTANAIEGVREACLQAGMDEFLVKPLDPHMLRELMLRYGIACV